jgi:hypothetical protein
MKILAIVKLYAHKNKAGGEMYLHHLLKDFQTAGANVNVLLPKCKKIETFEYDSIKGAETNEENWKHYIDLSDLVITQLDFSAEVMDYCLSIKKPVIHILHCHIDRDNKYLKNPNVIKIFNSKYIYNTALKESLDIQGKTFIIYPYTDYNKYKKYATTDLKYRQFITFINPQRSKGADVFYELAKAFPKRKFLLVEGGYYPHLQLVKYNLPNVTVHKNTDRILEDIYVKSRIVLQPSRYETYGMIASETRAMGLPCIVNGNSEGLVENIGQIGLYGFTPEKDATKKTIQTYIDLINALDHQPTYILWSNFLLENAERKYEEQREQVIDLLSYLMDGPPPQCS